MIPRLGVSQVSFGANQLVSARDAYNAQIAQNNRTAQEQNNVVVSTIKQSGAIPMQGQNATVGQKLDVIA